MSRPLAVAITGGIGAGKSTALESFRRHGAATVSRMKSKLPTCFCISAAFRETTTSCAPSRTASSALIPKVSWSLPRMARSFSVIVPSCMAPSRAFRYTSNLRMSMFTMTPKVRMLDGRG